MTRKISKHPNEIAGYLDMDKKKGFGILQENGLLSSLCRQTEDMVTSPIGFDVTLLLLRIRHVIKDIIGVLSS